VLSIKLEEACKKKKKKKHKKTKKTHKKNFKTRVLELFGDFEWKGKSWRVCS
jgi:predicted RNA-binding protein with RPS1 domain